jgi:hypothetical protein
VVAGFEASNEGSGVDEESSGEDNAGKACRGRILVESETMLKGSRSVMRGRGGILGLWCGRTRDLSVKI